VRENGIKRSSDSFSDLSVKFRANLDCKTAVHGLVARDRSKSSSRADF